jgi:CubicO group peptidase (beta-lactamase class C family)
MAPWKILFALTLTLATAHPARAAAGPGSAEQLGFSRERLERIDAWIEREIARKRTAGAVVLIARHGKVAWEKAYGVADIASGRPMRTDAMFRLYSMTKPITSVALLTLYERGRFQLTDPLGQYLPEFRDVKVYAGADAGGGPILRSPKREITIQDVFRHTAGFAYGYFGDTPVDRAYRAAGIEYGRLDSLATLVHKLATMPLEYDPGEHWVYSFAHDVQAYLVEYYSGMPFEEYCRKAIFEPLGMKDTVFGVPGARAARFPTTYTRDGAGTLKPLAGADDPYEHFTQHPFGGVSLSSTPRDYLRFAQMLLNGGELHGVRILGRKTVELMTSDHVPPATPTWSGGIRYGLGVSVLTDPAQAGNLGTKGEFGWSGHATTWVAVDPREDLIALLFAQYLPKDSALVDAFQSLVYQALVK